MNELELEKLLRAAGSRVEAPKEDMESIRASTHEAWKQAVATQQKSNTWRSMKSVAAAVLLFTVFGVGFNQYFLTQNKQNTVQVGQITHVEGRYLVNENIQTLNTPITTGDNISTDRNSVLSLVLNDDTHITMDADTQILFTSTSTLSITKGRIYVDSRDPNTSVVISTHLGKIEDIGTRYEVSVNPDSLFVAIRDGKVRVDLENNTTHFANFSAGEGDVLIIDSQLNVTKEKRKSTDETWNWTLAAEEHKNLQDATAYEVIEWASRVTGKTINYQSPHVKRIAKTTHMSGGQMHPTTIEQTLPKILKTTTLQAYITDSSIVIELGPNSIQ